MNNHAKHYLLLVGAKVLRVPLALLVVSLLSRLIGPEGVGQWSMLVAVSTFFHSVFLNWTQAPSVRFGREEWINSNSLSTTWGARRPLIFFGFILALFLLVLRPFSFFEQLTFLPSSWWPLAGVYLLGLWCLAEVQSLLTITENYKILAVLPLLVDTLLVFFLFFLILVPNEELKNNAIIGLVALTAFFWGGAWTKEFIRTRSWCKQTSWNETIRVLKFGWPMIPTFAVGYLIDWGDHFLLQHFHEAQQVGFFHAGYQVMLAMMALASPLMVIFLPKLIDMKSVDPNAELDYLDRVVPTVATLWLLAIIPGIALIPWVFEVVFGDEFLGARPAFYILCAAIPGAVFASLYTVLFNVQGRLGRTGLFHVFMFLANISISFLLIPRWGSLGAAIGTVISYLLIQGLYIFDQRKHLNLPSTKSTLLFFVASIYGFIQISVGGDMVGRIVVATMTMVGLLFMVKIWQICDRQMVSDLLPRQFAWMEKLLR
ncbi:MAG: oligosaccharide flippase family protein [Nitrospina sp.]|nr:oligosaccharide flippase family protein [Nitrospina sp.]